VSTRSVEHHFDGLRETAEVFTSSCSCGWRSIACPDGWEAGQDWGGHRRQRPSEE